MLNPSLAVMQPCEVEGIGSAELEFWFGVFLAPGRMGAAFLKLQLSTCEA